MNYILYQPRTPYYALYDRKLNFLSIEGRVSFARQTYFSITQSDTYQFARKHTSPPLNVEIIIPSIKCSVFDAFEVALSLERANEGGRIASFS